ncbi:MAG: hypothetical protein AAGH78_13725 [Cyanobacteria bacterium P01_H01_bin.58]
MTVCYFEGDRYSRQRYSIEQTIQSATFPGLQLTLRDLMVAIADA